LVANREKRLKYFERYVIMYFMRKTFKKWFYIVLSGVLSLGFSACDNLVPKTVSIEKVEKTGSEGLVDTYTIFYTDGTTGTFTITNGQDGVDAEGLVSIRSIEKTATNGLVDTYTIYFTDGSTTTFEVENGKDGDDVSVDALYQEYVERYGDISYQEFLSLYLSFGADNSATINRCLQSTARVYAEFAGKVTEENKTPAPAVYTGGAVIYQIGEESSYLLTNYHVVIDDEADGAPVSDIIHCYLYGSYNGPNKETDESGAVTVNYGDGAIACEYVGGSATYDMAVLKVNTADLLAKNPQATAVTFADEYYVGQTAIAIGNPNGDGISVTQGIVSVGDEFVTLTIGGETRSYRSLRMDTPLYKGNSGGGLFNADGELIGITNAGDLGDQNINFAVPIQIVKRTTDNILHYANDGDVMTRGVYKITLGITVTGQNSRYVYDTAKGYGSIKEEVLIKEITENSIAAQMGLQVGDVLTAITVDGEIIPINRYFAVGDVLLTMRTGAQFSLTIKRGEQTLTTLIYTVKKSDLALTA